MGSWVKCVRVVIGEGDLGGGGEVCLPLSLLLHIRHDLVQTSQLLIPAP